MDGENVIKNVIDNAEPAQEAPTFKAKPAPKSKPEGSGTASADNDPWGEPILFDHVFVTPEIDPVSVLPGVYGEFAHALSLNFQTPSALAVGMVTSILSTALAGKFVVKPYGDDSWIEPLMVWTLGIAETGEGKSQILSRCIKPLDQWEKLRRKEEKEALHKNNTKRRVLEKQAEKLELDAHKTEDEQEQAELIDKAAKIRATLPEQRFETKLYTNEATPESAQDLLAEQGGKMAFINDEGGLLQVMAGVYSGGNVITDVFLKGYNGMSVKVNRRCREVDVAEACITIGLSIQPGIIAKYPKAVREKFSDSGLFGRFFVFYPVSTLGKRDVRKRSQVPEELQRKYEESVMRLLEIQPEHSGKASLTLDAEALELWESFSELIERGQGKGGEYEGINKWSAKFRGGALRLAGLFHVAEHESRATETRIGKDCMAMAVHLLLLLIDHTRAFVGLGANDKAIEDAKAVWGWIVQEQIEDFKGSKAHNKFNGRFGRVEELEAALDVLKGRELIHGPYERKTEGGGRPSKWYRVNPKALRN